MGHITVGRLKRLHPRHFPLMKKGKTEEEAEEGPPNPALKKELNMVSTNKTTTTTALLSLQFKNYKRYNI